MNNPQQNITYKVNDKIVSQAAYKDLESKLQLPDPNGMACMEFSNGAGQMGTATSKINSEKYTYRFFTLHTPQGNQTTYELILTK